jgi:Cft2 family RNA processing exonuclease
VNIKFLGAHNAESKDTRLVSLLVDDVIAIDTGCTTSELSYSEQEKIKAILITHGHYDHIRGVPAYAFNNYCDVTQVYGTPKALDMLTSHLVDGIIYPNFTEKTPMCDQRSLDLVKIEPGNLVDVEGYQVLPLAVNHKLGAVGYQITDKYGKKAFFSGDTGHGLADVWKQVKPDILVIEVTFPNSREKTAVASQHLCPKMLKDELSSFHEINGYFPQVILIHLCPKCEKEIRADIAEVEKELGIAISIAVEGQNLEI